jgi:hypothetical protein
VRLTVIVAVFGVVLFLGDVGDVAVTRIATSLPTDCRYERTYAESSMTGSASRTSVSITSTDMPA